MIEANKYKLGIFVIVGFVLLLGVLFFLGLSEMFDHKAHLVTFFRESVQGLDVGSGVKYKGVPIGKVKRVSIRTQDKLIRVDMEIKLSSFDTKDDSMSTEKAYHFFYSFLKKEIKNGLRCQLNYAGITGMKYLEIDYFKGKLEVLDPPKIKGSGFYLPSVPSIFKDILRLINNSLEKISKIPFDELSGELADTFKSAGNLLKDPKITGTIAKLEEASNHLNTSMSTVSKVLTEEKIKEITENFKRSLTNINKLTEQVCVTIEESKIPQTSSKFRDASNSVTEAKRSLSLTLIKLNQAIDSVTELVNYIDNDPSALLRGKQKPGTMNRVIELENNRQK